MFSSQGVVQANLLSHNHAVNAPQDRRRARLAKKSARGAGALLAPALGSRGEPLIGIGQFWPTGTNGEAVRVSGLTNDFAVGDLGVTARRPIVDSERSPRQPLLGRRAVKQFAANVTGGWSLEVRLEDSAIRHGPASSASSVHCSPLHKLAVADVRRRDEPIPVRPFSRRTIVE